MTLDYSIELINDQKKLLRLINRLTSTPVVALDIETVNWWNRHQERIALIQIAFRTERQPKVVIIGVLGTKAYFFTLSSPFFHKI